MSELLENGFCVKTFLGGTVKVEKFLAEGGQGEVYLVDYNGQKKALKWYKKSSFGEKPTAFYENIKQNVMRGTPSPEFLWPLDITGWMDDTFGYVMDLCPDGYYQVTEYMLCHVRFKSYQVVIDAAMRIVSAFRILHNAGYSYQDLNDGNFFINPQSGKVLICDNDNVAPDGTETGISGKPRYMAPEIVLCKSKPNSLSDRFSMSLILYILFCLNHPLEGKRYLVPGLTPALQERLYGSEPLFIMDPDDNSNGPHPVIHKNSIDIWPCLPNYMQKIFHTSFCQKAFEKPNARPREIDWLNVLTRFRSEIVACQCGNEIFTQQGEPCNCEACGCKADIPFRLELSRYSIPAVKDSRIYRCQLGVCDEKDALKPVAQVVQKKESGALGIRNKSGKRWDAITTKGTARKVAADEVIPLKDGIIFKTGDESITIKAN
ncbi:MAG: serine/threonine protein kinase [Eubacterium sp.]|jgi:serine/threonine protein kinase|nr:serine/threonine protein kinase [Eubacterium sp.]